MSKKKSKGLKLNIATPAATSHSMDASSASSSWRPSASSSPGISSGTEMSRLQRLPGLTDNDSLRSAIPSAVSDQDYDSAPYQHEPIMILPNLYLGSEKNASTKEMLLRKNIGYIVNVGIECRNHFENCLVDSDIENNSDMTSGLLGPVDQFPVSPLYNPLNIVRKIKSKSDMRHAAPLNQIESNDAINNANKARSSNTHVDQSDANTTDPSKRCDPPKSKASNYLRSFSLRKPMRLRWKKCDLNTSSSSVSTSRTSPMSVLADGFHRVSASSPPLTPPSARSSPAESRQSLSSPTLPTPPIDTAHFVPPTYLKVPWTHNQDNLIDDFPRAFEFIDQARRRDVGVLVHCKQGVSRSASLVIGYVMKELGMSLNEAYAYVKTRSPNVTPNLGLIYQLLEYERELAKKVDGSIVL